MTSEEIRKIFKSQKLPRVANIFYNHNINGKALLLLKKQDLTDMGIVAVGELVIIKDVVKKLKNIDHNLRIYKR